MEHVVTYLPKILKSMREICEEMGVGEKVVRRWVACGAPIAVEGEGTHAPSALEGGIRERTGWGMTPAPVLCSTRQSRAHGVRRFFNDSEVRTDGRIRSTLSLFPIPQHGY